MDINEHLAINVMGWEIQIENIRCGHIKWLVNKNDKKRIQTIALWNPSNNIDQAFTCLEKYAGIWSMEYDGLGTYGVDINMETSVQDRSLAMAICRACAIATGWKEDGHTKG